ncbi:hypothetical protein [Mesorhizobium sp. CN2-181]|uniref:hypothetical protein n=1 Tax=Mesorhizobium yinganensis TaxID=3157707 RepID=UPI0032B75473
MSSSHIFGNPDLTVNRMVGSAYDTVKLLAENIEYVKHVSAHLEEIWKVGQSTDQILALEAELAKLVGVFENLTGVLTVYENIDEVVATSEHIPELTAIFTMLAKLEVIHDNLSNILTYNVAGYFEGGPVDLLDLSGANPSTYTAGATIQGVVLGANTRIAHATVINGVATGDPNNGIWKVNASGAPSRAADADTNGKLSRHAFQVKSGDHLGETWYVSNLSIANVGTDPITIAFVSPALSWNGEIIAARGHEASVLANIEFNSIQALSSLTNAGEQRPVVISVGGFHDPIQLDDVVMIDTNTLQAGDWLLEVQDLDDADVPSEIFNVSFGGFHDPVGTEREDESLTGSSSGSGSGNENFFSDEIHALVRTKIDTERKRLMSLNCTPLKRVNTGWRVKPRTGQSFEARDNMARRFLDAAKTTTFLYHAAMIGPDVGGVDSDGTHTPFNSDTRKLWTLREMWTAGTNTDTVYTDQQIIDGAFTSNSRGGGPAPLSVWARQWLRREYLGLPQDTRETAVLDLVYSTAKGEGATAEVYDGVGRTRLIDGIRVTKEAITHHTVEPTDPIGSQLTLPSAVAPVGVEIIHNLHGQAPNTVNETGYGAVIKSCIDAFAAAIADPTTGFNQSEPFAFTMMQPGAVGWATQTNVICDQMSEMADDVTGDHKFTFLIGNMWAVPSKEVMPLKATFTASIAGTTLTVTSFTSGSLAVGDCINAANVSAGTKITAIPVGGGPGAYTISVSHTSVTSRTMYGSFDPDATNGHPLQAGNILHLGCPQGIAEHYILDRNENFWTPKMLPAWKSGNKALIPICAKFPGIQEVPVFVSTTPTILDNWGISIEKLDGSVATIVSKRIVPGEDMIEIETAEDLADYVTVRTGRNDGVAYFGINNIADGFTCNLPIKVPFTVDNTRQITGHLDNPRLNGLGRYAEDYPGQVGEINWGINLRLHSTTLTDISEIA